MDPLSVALAVISLITAAKDVAELGHKICQSFTMTSHNFRRAQRVAEEIQQMAEELKVFCEDHQDALAGMNDFSLALQALLGKFRSFESSILPLLPQTGMRTRNRFFRGWDEWRNGSKIEASIVDLQTDIIKVMRRHMMKSTMRTEVKLKAVQQETSRGFTSVQNRMSQGLQVLEDVRRDVSALRVTAATTMSQYEASWTTEDEFNRNIVMFANSPMSAPVLRTTNVITEELLTIAYIKFQLNSIAAAVENMSELQRVPILNVGGVENFCLSLLLRPASMNIVYLRHHVVRQVTDIRDLLDTKRISTILVYGGASALNDLSVGLKALHMVQESLLVGRWAIKLARKLVGASGVNQPHLHAALALYLLNQSVRYGDDGDSVKSLLAIKEAHQITRRLSSRYEAAIHYQLLHSDVLSQYSQLVDNQASIAMTMEAVRILEDVLRVKGFTQSMLNKNVDSVPPSLFRLPFLDHLFSSAPTIYPIISYARALQRLGTYLSNNGHSEIALKLYRLAIALRRKMVAINGPEYKVELAIALSSLVRRGPASGIPNEELVDMADECIELFRVLVMENPVRYAHQIVPVLWTKATTLDSLDRHTEAISAWEEVTSIAGQIIHDSSMCATALDNLSNQFRRLERHEDAVRTGTLTITTYRHGTETQALRYLHLSNDLRALRRYKQSAEAAQTSVSLYRTLAMKDIGTWKSYLAGALSTLARCLASVSNYSEALSIWQESMGLLESFLDAGPDESGDFFQQYLAALSIHPSFATILIDEEQSLKVCSTTVRYAQRMLSAYPQSSDLTTTLLWCEFCYSYNMLRVGNLQEGLQHIDGCLDLWRTESLLKAMSAPELEAWQALMIALKADALDAQGRAEQALCTTQMFLENVRRSSANYKPCASLIIDSMVREARLQVVLGNKAEAIQVATSALQLARNNKPEPIVDDLVLSLHGVTFVALSYQDYERASEAAQEGCRLYDTHLKSQLTGSEDNISIYPGLFALLSLAEANLGRCSSALQCARRSVNMSLDIREMQGCVSTTIAELSYMETRGNLANIYLATGDHTLARQICEERKAYFLKRVEKRIGDYRELVPILRMLGVLYCSEGRHEDGAATAEEMSDIMKTLCTTFPSLHKQVKNRLHSQAKTPILKVLGSLSQGANCRRQTEYLASVLS